MKFMNKWIKENWTGGIYRPSLMFQTIKSHCCVCKPDGNVIALAGPVGDHESLELTWLIAAAPDMFQLLERMNDFAKTGFPLHWHALATADDETTFGNEITRVLKKAQGSLR